MRLDLFLTKNLSIQSRNKACELIKTHKVKIDGTIISKPSFIVEKKHKIELLENEFYVSRAAKKLKFFLDEFDIDIRDKIALDIGSSTGGFTQILLEKEVKSITCVDVGDNQLHTTLKTNPKIEFFEKCDIRDFSSSKEFNLVTCDVSFISIHNILHSINTLAKDKIIILYKPQFEVGINAKRDKKGVVQDLEIIKMQRDKFLTKCKEINWELSYNQISKVSGKEGNIEELFYFRKLDKIEK